MGRTWKDKVTISRQDFLTLLKTYKARLVVGDWRGVISETTDDEEIAHRFFDILKDHRSK